MGSTPLGGCIGYFLKFLFLNFHSHIKDSKWGRKRIFNNCTSCNGSRQQIPFQFTNGKLPHSVAEHPGQYSNAGGGADELAYPTLPCLTGYPAWTMIMTGC